MRDEVDATSSGRSNNDVAQDAQRDPGAKVGAAQRDVAARGGDVVKDNNGSAKRSFDPHK